MRKITEDAIRAFRNNQPFKRGNTWVQITHGRRFLHLHGNVIAEMTPHGELWICDAGWQTVTTKERLNGFNMVNIVQKDFEWYLNGELWDGSLIKVEW
jgi:hypothetical protein|tara:strand:+ start:179 stop:472 length:294 start_codon:yes stop_codon:yes gene_type:complete